MASIPKTAGQIRTVLLDRIAKELPGYKPGEKIPTYDELMAELPAKRATLGRAIKGLQEEGVLVGIRGGGVYVAERP